MDEAVDPDSGKCLETPPTPAQRAGVTARLLADDVAGDGDFPTQQYRLAEPSSSIKVAANLQVSGDAATSDYNCR